MTMRRRLYLNLILCAAGMFPGCSGCRTPEKPIEATPAQSAAESPENNDKTPESASPEPVESTAGEPSKDSASSDAPSSAATSPSPPPQGPIQPESSPSAGTGPAGSSSPSNPSSASRKSPAPAMSLPEALAEAKNLEARAASAEKKGNRVSELTLATQAWQLVRQFPESAEARQHRSRLEKRIESAAQAANAAAPGDGFDRNVMLIER